MKFLHGQIRQGDVALIKVAGKIPDGWKKVADGPVVLAHGEVTGHMHKFGRMDRVSLYRPDDCGLGGAVIVEEKPATLYHEEHTEKLAEAGLYLQPVQVEETPAAIRTVQD